VQGSDEHSFDIQIRVWLMMEEKEFSSNWKEFSNLVDIIEHEYCRGKLFHVLFFMFTDNSMVEGAVAKGNSPGKRLHDLVTKLRFLQINIILICLSFMSWGKE